GSVSITASQPGNAIYAPASDVVRSFSVSKRSQVITFATPTNMNWGADPQALVATASSGLPVQFVQTIGNASLAGSVIAPDGAGVIGITAQQDGNEIWSSTSVYHEFQIARRPWVNRSLSTASNLVDVAYGTGKFVVLAGYKNVYHSDAGYYWNRVTFTSNYAGKQNNFSRIAYGQPQALMVPIISRFTTIRYHRRTVVYCLLHPHGEKWRILARA
ncbi:MAG: hypothetical protein NT154_05460, partial [Verrucomicrobia bacterium]|nr:hypothetical protein [Verrucomicrobiota bacterium]